MNRRGVRQLMPLLRAVGVCAAAMCAVCAAADLNVVYQWDKIDLTLHEGAAAAGPDFAPDNNLVHRMRIWNDTMYVSVPRLRPGVPATLCRSGRTVGGGVGGGALRPFPSAGMQAVGNCFALQNVRDIEIDHLGQLWALDVGRVNELDPATADRTCDPKLVVLDAVTGTVLRSAVVPPGMRSDRSALTGLTVDLKTLTAVVADLSPVDPGFLVYDMQSGVFKKFYCKTLLPPPDSATGGGAGGPASRYDEAQLVASPVDNMLYFTTVRLGGLYALPLSVFDAPLIADVSHHANGQGPKTDTSTAMAMDQAGHLYLGMTRKVVAWDTLRHSFDYKDLYVQEVRLEWISSLAFDAHNYLWIVSSAYRDFLDGSRTAHVKVFKRYCGKTSFALLETAANETAAAAAAAAAAAGAASGKGDRAARSAAVAAVADAGRVLALVAALRVAWW